MADTRVTQLGEMTTVTTDDLIVVVDNTTSTTKKVQAGNMLPDGVVSAAKLATNAVGTTNISNASVTDAKMDYPRWYQELGRTILGSAATSIAVTSLPARKYLRVIISIYANGGNIRAIARFNSDAANNYSYRYSFNTGATTTGISAPAIILSPAENSSQHVTVDISNLAAAEKPVSATGFTTGSPGAGNTATSITSGGKWANTANQITRIDIVNDQGTTFNVGSEVIVLGHD